MGLFGNFFDFDGEGTVSMFEELLRLELLAFFGTKEDDEEDEDEEPEGEDWL